MGFTDSDICSHCTLNTTDNYMHATWDCTPIQQFWRDITDNLSSLLGCHIPLSPTLCLLGDTLNNISSRILSIALTIAKKTILMNWKTRNKINTTTLKISDQWNNYIYNKPKPLILTQFGTHSSTNLLLNLALTLVIAPFCPETTHQHTVPLTSM